MLTATHDGGELTVHFTAHAELCDLGVPRSPVWIEPTGVEISALEICGVEVDPAILPEAVQAAILELHEACEFQAED